MTWPAPPPTRGTAGAELSRSAPTRLADDLLAGAGWLSVGGIAVALAALHPALVLALLVPGALHVRCRTELARWRQRAETDPLTGLRNAHGWRHHAAHTLTSNPGGRPSSGPAVLVIDVDRFKTVNDTYGHLTGDAVLCSVAAAVAASVGADCVAGRIGGDEFAVALPRAAPAELVTLAERIRAAVNATVTAVDGWTVNDVSVSIGAAVSSPAASSVHALLAAADAALYEAKNAGRDAVRLAVLPQSADD